MGHLQKRANEPHLCKNKIKIKIKINEKKKCEKERISELTHLRMHWYCALFSIVKFGIPLYLFDLVFESIFWLWETWLK